MARSKATQTNIDGSDLGNYPDKRIRNNDGSGNGTPVTEAVYGDIHEFFARIMRLAGTTYNGLPDNVTNGYQLVDAFSFLPNKNNFIYNLSSVGGLLSLSLKLSKLKTDEFLICQASSNLGTETQIKGSDAVVFPIVSKGNFKIGEFVRVIKTLAGFTLIRLTDDISLDLMATELLYLKKALYAQEIAGVLDTVATNPLSNALAFVERVNGPSSSVSLANLLRNGLYPKEHFAIVAGLGVGNVKNIGWFSGLDLNFSGAVGTALQVSGDFSSAVYLANPAPGNSVVEVTMNNLMNNLNYKVNISVESEGNIDFDNDCTNFVFKKISTSKFRISAAEISGTVQNLKIHLEVVQL